jgi:hypothetical protein
MGEMGEIGEMGEMEKSSCVAILILILIENDMVHISSFRNNLSCMQ